MSAESLVQNQKAVPAQNQKHDLPILHANLGHFFHNDHRTIVQIRVKPNRRRGTILPQYIANINLYDRLILLICWTSFNSEYWLRSGFQLSTQKATNKFVEHHHGRHRSRAYVQIFRRLHKIIHIAAHHMNRKSILDQMVCLVRVASGFWRSWFFRFVMCWVVNYHGVFWVSGDFRFERGQLFTQGFSALIMHQHQIVAVPSQLGLTYQG